MDLEKDRETVAVRILSTVRAEIKAYKPSAMKTS